MNRSEINTIQRESIEVCDRMNFHLPPWAFWSPDEWLKAGHDYDEIRDNRLGWDITRFGGDDFASLGLALFTIRNGNPNPASGYRKPYCEKLLIVHGDQRTPFHYHASKMEDIICRAGGNLIVQVYNRADDDQLAETPVHVSIDGRNYPVDAGAKIRLTPGESITLPPYQYHEFWAEAGHGTALVGEVSTVNDDQGDNKFLRGEPRFDPIEEDAPKLHLLCNEYPPAAESEQPAGAGPRERREQLP